MSLRSTLALVGARQEYYQQKHDYYACQHQQSVQRRLRLYQGFLTGGIHTPWGYETQMLGVWDSISHNQVFF